MAARATVRPRRNNPKSLSIEERIRLRAHQIYLQRGGREGSELDDWLQAEAEINRAEGPKGLTRTAGES